MLEESPPLAMTAYTARSRLPCPLIRICISQPGSGTGLFIHLTDDGHPCRLDELANAIMMPGWETHDQARNGRVCNSTHMGVLVRRIAGSCDFEPGCNIIYDFTEFMHMLDTINMGEFPFEDMEMGFGRPDPPDTEIESSSGDTDTEIISGSDLDTDSEDGWHSNADTDPEEYIYD